MGLFQEFIWGFDFGYILEFWTLEVCFEDSYGIPIGITLGICRILQISLFENICMGSIGVPLEGFLRVFQSLFRGLFTTIKFQLLKLKKLLEVFYSNDNKQEKYVNIIEHRRMV